jgi:hypothetical protein
MPRHSVLDIKNDNWPKFKDIMSETEDIHKSITKFNESQDILGSIPERVKKEKIGIVGKGTNKLHIGKP